MHETSVPLWQPSAQRLASSHITAFSRLAQTVWGQPLPNYDSLWQASITHLDHFWSLVWDYTGVIGDKGQTLLNLGDTMRKTRFFPEARLNYAENILRYQGTHPAIFFQGEDETRREWDWDTLHAKVSRLQQAMQAMGIVAGDRVAGFMPNIPETVAAMLAATSLGAIWTSTSPEFGSESALDRFSQTTPKLLFCPDGYWYNGKAIDIRDKVIHIAEQLSTLQQIVIVPYIGTAQRLQDALPNAQDLEQFIAPYTEAPVTFERLPFDHPLFILYSSGTTGKPKCIVHGAGGTLLQLLKEHQLHADIHQGDRLFYFTTCGWMMWNWLVTGLASGATLMLYDGSPLAQEGRRLWDYAEQCHTSHFGCSAKYIDELRKIDFRPNQYYRLDALRALFSTGSPLSAESFEWVYQSVKADLHLASMSGGTDIISCFVLGAPNLPVYRGELQCRGLGMAVDVVDEHGSSLHGLKGELVCRQAFPSMPIYFWEDVDGERYHNAYFARLPNVWCHGDYAQLTEHNGVIIFGRSDTVLNPGGVRIGTAEIYRQVEATPEVLEAVAVGQRWNNDERIILFVRLKEGIRLDEALSDRIKQTIRVGASSRHVPARIIAVADIPRTVNGKIAELAVKQTIHNEAVANLGALLNPEALAYFANCAELQS